MFRAPLKIKSLYAEYSLTQNNNTGVSGLVAVKFVFNCPRASNLIRPPIECCCSLEYYISHAILCCYGYVRVMVKNYLAKITFLKNYVHSISLTTFET